MSENPVKIKILTKECRCTPNFNNRCPFFQNDWCAFYDARIEIAKCRCQVKQIDVHKNEEETQSVLTFLNSQLAELLEVCTAEEVAEGVKHIKSLK